MEINHDVAEDEIPTMVSENELPTMVPLILPVDKQVGE